MERQIEIEETAAQRRNLGTWRDQLRRAIRDPDGRPQTSRSGVFRHRAREFREDAVAVLVKLHNQDELIKDVRGRFPQHVLVIGSQVGLGDVACLDTLVGGVSARSTAIL